LKRKEKVQFHEAGGGKLATRLTSCLLSRFAHAAALARRSKTDSARFIDEPAVRR
jgi:hypothetical protein